VKAGSGIRTARSSSDRSEHKTREKWRRSRETHLPKVWTLQPGASAQLPQCFSSMPPAGTQKNIWSCRRHGVTPTSMDRIGQPTALSSHIKSQGISEAMMMIFEESKEKYVSSGQCTGV